MAAGPVKSHYTTLVDITDRKIPRSKIGLGDEDNGNHGQEAGFILVALARRCDSLQGLVEEAGLGSFTLTVSSVGPRPFLSPALNSRSKREHRTTVKGLIRASRKPIDPATLPQSRVQGFLMLAAIRTV